jgi:hypothetical protein
MPNVFLMNEILPNVILLSVILPNVVAPSKIDCLLCTSPIFSRNFMFFRQNLFQVEIQNFNYSFSIWLLSFLANLLSINRTQNFKTIKLFFPFPSFLLFFPIFEIFWKISVSFYPISISFYELIKKNQLKLLKNKKSFKQKVFVIFLWIY